MTLRVNEQYQCTFWDRINLFAYKLETLYSSDKLKEFLIKAKQMRKQKEKKKKGKQSKYFEYQIGVNIR